MSDMKHVLRDIGYLGVGAAAVIIEVGAKAGKALIRKGEKTLRENQDTVDDLKRKAKDLGDKMKDAVEKVSAKADAVCEADAACDTCADEPERPVAPDVIYHAETPEQGEIPEEPAESDAPEDTPNG